MNRFSSAALSLIVFLALSPLHALGASGDIGILVLAHGTRQHGDHMAADEGRQQHHDAEAEELPPWEKAVEGVVREAAGMLEMEVELAFGMWNRESFQRGVDGLAARDVETIRVVPLFVSSHSLVIRAQRHLFGLGDEQLPFDPGRIDYPAEIWRVEYASPLDTHPILTEILLDRALALAEEPGSEELVLVAHGPVSEEDDLRWLEDLALHADRIQATMAARGQSFAGVHFLTLRDDAPAAVRDRMTRELRNLVSAIAGRGRVPLLLPVLLAEDGIEAGLLRRLENLSFRYRGEMIAPHPRLADWIVEAARSGDVEVGTF